MKKSTRLPRRSDDCTQRGRFASNVLVWVTGSHGALVVVLLAVNAPRPGGAGLSLLYAFLPLPVLWLAYWLLDRCAPQPLRYKFAAFSWGIIIATSASIVIQMALDFFTDIGDYTLASWVAPATEEPAKCAFLVATFFRARKVVDGVIAGLIYSGLLGIGFAVLENVGYYLAAYTQGLDDAGSGTKALTGLFIVRGIATPLSHPLFTSAFGIAIGLAALLSSRIAKIALAIAGLAASIMMHHFWNAGVSPPPDPWRMLWVYLGLGLVLLAIVVVAIILCIRQLRILQRSLAYMALRGWIDPYEAWQLADSGLRRIARKHARARGGRKAVRAMKRYQRIATDAAFLHHAMMTGRPKINGVARTHRMLSRMYMLRELFPPPIQQTATPVY